MQQQFTCDMKRFTTPTPAYIFEKGNLIKMVAFTALFAITFINIYEPFGSGNWMDSLTSFYYFLYSSVIVLIGFVVIALSRVVMYFWYQRQKIVVLQYIVWILVEVFFMALFFTIIALAMRPGVNAIDTFKDSVLNTLLILAFPYLICHLFLSWVEKNKRLEERDIINPVNSAARMIDFYDERKILRLSVMKSNVLYVEAADNYVCIFYKKKSGVARFMLRNTLKALESYLADVDIVRCHRSYMVNLEYVSVIRRQSGGIYLELSIPEVPDIPLSHKYRDKVDAWFKSTE